jgi:hypothetical protein
MFGLAMFLAMFGLVMFGLAMFSAMFGLVWLA